MSPFAANSVCNWRSGPTFSREVSTRREGNRARSAIGDGILPPERDQSEAESAYRSSTGPIAAR